MGCKLNMYIFPKTELAIIQDNARNFTALDLNRTEYLNSTGPVSCHYWRASLGKYFDQNTRTFFKTQSLTQVYSLLTVI